MVRVRSLVPVLFALAAIPVMAMAQGRSAPPSDLQMRHGHWTPYDSPDPASFPPDARVHIIASGETLWSIASQYYGNPYLWPQLWEQNTYIRDAHWIYPGDPLLIQGESAAADVAAVDEMDIQPVVTSSGISASADLPMGVPIALGTEADILCWGYLGQEDEYLPIRVGAFEDVELKYVEGARSQDTGAATGEILYIEGDGVEGLIPGETYLVVKPQQLVVRPGSRDVIGRHYDYRGQVRILCLIEGRAVAYISQSCSTINIGDRLKPLPLAPIPLSRETRMANACTPVNGKQTGYIVNAKDYSEALGEGSLVEIDLGRDDFVEPGDFLTIYRHVPHTNSRQILGEVGVLTAEPGTATGRITRMRYSMRVGDMVEVK